MRSSHLSAALASASFGLLLSLCLGQLFFAWHAASRDKGLAFGESDGGISLGRIWIGVHCCLKQIHAWIVEHLLAVSGFYAGKRPARHCGSGYEKSE